MTISPTIAYKDFETNLSTNLIASVTTTTTEDIYNYLWSHDFMINTNANNTINVSLIIANSVATGLAGSAGSSSSNIGVQGGYLDNNGIQQEIIGSDVYNQTMDGQDVHKELYKNSIVFIVTTSIILTILTICTVIGNILVIAAVLLERNLRTPANYLVLSLAVADFLVACLVMPLGAFYEIQGQWTLGDLLCEFWISVDVLCCSASILHLLAIAMDRYWAVTNVDYIHQRNAKRIGLMIASIWLVAAIIALAPNFGWKDSQFKDRILIDKICLVSQNISYQIFATVATFYAPLILILVLYWKIYKVARKRIRRKPGSKIEIRTSQSEQPIILNSPTQLMVASTITTISPAVDHRHNQSTPATTHELNHMTTRLPIHTIAPPVMSITDRSTSTSGCTSTATNNHSPPMSKPILLRSKSTLKQTLTSKREKKAAKTLAIVTGVFVICWAPFFILALLMPICSTCSPPLLLMSVFLWLGYVNSLLNCIIYTIFSPDFRTAFKKLLCGRHHRYRHSFR